MFLYAYLYTKQRVEPKVLIELVFIAFQSLDNRFGQFCTNKPVQEMFAL